MVGVANTSRIEQSTLHGTEELVINMGPQHPSTHGVLRVILKLDGETVNDLDCDIGYLHRGTEKIGENITYTMFIPYTDRLDYIAAPSNNLAWVTAVEKFFDWEIPMRAQYIRSMVGGTLAHRQPPALARHARPGHRGDDGFPVVLQGARDGARSLRDGVRRPPDV